MNNILFGKGWALKQYDGKSLENFDLLNLQYINIQKYPYLLESSSRGNLNNRFSILFYKPEFSFEKIRNNFLSKFDEYWREEKIDQERLSWKKKKLPFSGGWFVYFGYELSKEIEPKLNIPDSPYELPTAFASRIKTSIIFDHIDNEIFVVSEEMDDFSNICLDIENDFQKITEVNSQINGTIEFKNKGSEEEHQEQVKKCIEYIFSRRNFSGKSFKTLEL